MTGQQPTRPKAIRQLSHDVLPLTYIIMIYTMSTYIRIIGVIMGKANKTKYAILGLLSYKPQSGYDLKKMTDRSIGFFWNESYGHIYPILKRLEQQKLLAREVKTGKGRPDRNIYRITAAGKRELREWLPVQPIDQPKRNELLLKLFFGSQVNAKNLIPMVASKKEKSEELLKRLEEIGDSISRRPEKDAPFWGMTLNYGKYFAKANIDWCRKTLKTLQRIGGKEAL